MLSVPELVAAALAAEDGDKRWDCVCELHSRGAEAFRMAVGLCSSRDPQHRALGVDILAQLDGDRPSTQREFRIPAADLLLGLLPTEQDPDVLQSVCVAFGHLGDSRCVELLEGLRNHGDCDVREAVAFGLCDFDDPKVIEVLLELSNDSDRGVRSWATFRLGHERPSLSAAGGLLAVRVRDALALRLADDYDDVRAEGLTGLALMGDARALGPLLAILDGEDEGVREFILHLDEIACRMAVSTQNPRLCSYVAEYRDRWLAKYGTKPYPDELSEALRICADG